MTLLFGRTQYLLGAVVLTLKATAYSELFFRNRLFSSVLLSTTVEKAQLSKHGKGENLG
jgi:hypothetical protein